MPGKTRLLFLIILVEGYVVLACELLAIRQLIPFVGSGTETISIVISAVLLPLAVGYHAGGRAFSRAYGQFRRRHDRGISVRKILLRNIVSALAILSIGLSYPFLEIFFGLLHALGVTHRLAQTALYSALFLVTPVFLLGQTVPLVSNYFSRRRLSEITGRMLFFSTAGSFLGSVFSTIVLMTFIGVHNTVIVTMGLLTVLALVLARRALAYETFLCLFIFALVGLVNGDYAMRRMGIVSNNAYNMVNIIDLPGEDAKIFEVNRSYSSKISRDPANHFEYVRYIQEQFIGPISDPARPARDVLVIGAGGFTIGLDDTHNRYTFVDIDGDLKDVAETHFLGRRIGDSKRFVAASAKAFVHSDTQHYDLIIIDAYTNIFSIPMECTTREFLLEVKKRLKERGVVIANVVGSATFEDRFSARYHNTFASVFGVFSRQMIGDISAWPGVNPDPKRAERINNVLYIYFNGPHAGDRTVYSNDQNTYSLDRN